jgi:phytoene dehydrogenase-like protein
MVSSFFLLLLSVEEKEDFVLLSKIKSFKLQLRHDFLYDGESWSNIVLTMVMLQSWRVSNTLMFQPLLWPWTFFKPYIPM